MSLRTLTKSALLASFSVFIFLAPLFLFSSEENSHCRRSIRAQLGLDLDKPPEGAAEAIELLRKSREMFGTQYDSNDPSSGVQFVDSFPTAASLSNENETWYYLRDRGLQIARAHPHRFVVSTGLQQSLEFVFAGASRVLMVDAYGPNITAFVWLSELSRLHKQSSDFFAHARLGLKILRPTGDGPSSYASESGSISEFIGLLNAYGEDGYQRFRSAALSGNLKAYLQDAGDPLWGETVREMVDDLAPSVVYTSNIVDWLKGSQLILYAKSLAALTLDHEAQNFVFDLFRRPSIEFGSWIAQTNAGFRGFSWQAGRLWELKRGPTTLLSKDLADWTYLDSARMLQANSIDLIDSLNFSYVEVRNKLTSRVDFKGLLKLMPGKVMINDDWGSEFEIAYDPQLHDISPRTPPHPLAQILQFKNHYLRFRSRKTLEITSLHLDRPLSFLPEGGSYSVVWEARSETGAPVRFTFSDRSHEIVEILSRPK